MSEEGDLLERGGADPAAPAGVGEGLSLCPPPGRRGPAAQWPAYRDHRLARRAGRARRRAAALQFHIDRTGNKPSQNLAQIAHVLVLVAQHADDQVVTLLKRYRANLSPKRDGLKRRPREALRQFTDCGNIEKLLMLPERIHRRLRRKPVHTIADARLMQVAVMLELLLMRPIRRSNLVALRLGKHVVKVRSRTMIAIDGAEVKNDDYPVPSESVRLLDFYVERLLPLFGDNPMRFLFPGEVPGRPKSGEQFGRFFTKTIREETGLKVYPHLLRHFGATLYLTENPEGLDVVRRVLGHRSAETTYRSYAGVQDEIAVRRLDELVLGIRATILKELGDA